MLLTLVALGAKDKCGQRPGERGRHTGRRRRAPAFAAVGGLDRDPRPGHRGRVEGGVADRLDPGEDLADFAALALVAPVVLVGDQAGGVDTGLFGEEQGARHVEALGHDHGVVDVEDRAGPDHRRPGVEARRGPRRCLRGVTPSRTSALRIVSGSS